MMKRIVSATSWVAMTFLVFSLLSPLVSAQDATPASDAGSGVETPATDTSEPWVEPTMPVELPTEIVTDIPTAEPTVVVTEEHVVPPTDIATEQPTGVPTAAPTAAPTETVPATDVPTATATTTTSATVSPTGTPVATLDSTQTAETAAPGIDAVPSSDATTDEEDVFTAAVVTSTRTDFGNAMGFNLFVIDNMTGVNGDTEGCLAVGGNLTVTIGESTTIVPAARRHGSSAETGPAQVPNPRVTPCMAER